MCNTSCIYLICCLESGSDELYERITFSEDATDWRKLGIKQTVAQGLGRVWFNFDNSQRVFGDFVATRMLVVWQKIKVRMVDRVSCRYVEFWARNVARRGEMYLPKSLFDKPLLGSFFKDFRGFR